MPVSWVIGHVSASIAPANHNTRSANSALAREMKPTYSNFCPRPVRPGFFLSCEKLVRLLNLENIATVLRTKALWHLHGYSLAVVCCGGASERRHWHRFCQYSASSRAWGSVIFASPSDSALPRDVDWQVLDARLLNWLRVELHQSQYLLRHTHFDGEPQRAGFSCSKRVVMRPMSTRKLIREGFRSRWIHPRRQ